MCVSCNRAGSALRHRGLTRKDPSFKAMADQFYADLMGVAA